MMKNTTSFGFALLACTLLATNISLCSYAKIRKTAEQVPSRADSIIAAYSDSLLQTVNNIYQVSVDSDAEVKLTTPSPYLFRLFCNGTVYDAALHQEMGYGDAKVDTFNYVTKTLPSLGDKTDTQLLLNTAINSQLSKAYVTFPRTFSSTEDALDQAGTLRNELSTTIQEDVKLAEEVVPEVPDIVIEQVEPEVKKPNFWECKGNGSLQFSQNFFTENWYQGGTKSYSMLVALTLEAHYNDKQKLQWDNVLDAQLGFQTMENSTPKFRATTDLLRFTTKIGYKMAKNWNYAGRIILESQPFPIYSNDGKKITSTFASPLIAKTSVGIDWKLNLKRFTSSLYLAPVEYNLTYVHRPDIRPRYGMNEDQPTKHEWGPNITLTYEWRIWDNISWNARLYWFSNFKLTRIEWENTFNFTINKYLSAKLFLYPRFDDSSTKYYSEDNNYFMFKEWLSLGLNMNF